MVHKLHFFLRRIIDILQIRLVHLVDELLHLLHLLVRLRHLTLQILVFFLQPLQILVLLL